MSVCCQYPWGELESSIVTYSTMVSISTEICSLSWRSTTETEFLFLIKEAILSRSTMKMVKSKNGGNFHFRYNILSYGRYLSWGAFSTKFESLSSSAVPWSTAPFSGPGTIKFGVSTKTLLPSNLLAVLYNLYKLAE